MSDLDFLDLSRQLGALRIAVRKNVVRCDTRFAQSLHEKLLLALNGHLKTCREGAKVQRRLRNESDPTVRESLEQTLGDCMGDLESGGRGFYPWHLLDAVDGDQRLSGKRRYVRPPNKLREDERQTVMATSGHSLAQVAQPVHFSMSASGTSATL